MYIGGVSMNVTLAAPIAGSIDSDAGQSMWVGARNNGGSPDRELDGKQSSLRLSNIIRSAAYIKANNAILTDNIVSWGAVEIIKQVSWQVVDGATPLQRNVFAYDQTTGAFLDSTTSDINGDFAITLPTTDPVKIVVAGDPGSNQNDLIFANVVPE